jgi:hypothetical protein
MLIATKGGIERPGPNNHGQEKRFGEQEKLIELLGG